MNRRAVGLFAWFAASGGLVVWGCQSNSSTTGAGTGGATSSHTSSASMSDTSTTSSTGGSGGQMVTCDGMDAKVTDLNDGTIGPNLKVKLTGVVAMSQKFLVTKSSSDSCIWGVFISAPNLTETAEYSGVLLESYGIKATKPDGGTKTFCPRLGTDPTGDAIPDDVKPGDVFDVFGESKNFLLSQCSMQDGGMGASVGQIQLLVDAACALKKTSSVTPPTPHVLTGADIASLGDPNDAMAHAKWGGVKIRLQNQTPIVDAMGAILFDNFGNFHLMGSNVQVGDKLYYQGYNKSNPCHVAPLYAMPNPVFTQIDGFSLLDFCTWALEPGDKCADIQPPSDDCMGMTCGG